MKRNYLLLLFAVLSFAGKSFAQGTVPCATDEVYREMKQRFPKIAEFEKAQEEYIKNYARANGHLPGARTTSVHADSDYYDIPVVVHIIHNYGAEFLSDDKVYKMINELNNFYQLKNDTSNIDKEFKKYVGKAKVRFHLATIDPNGNPTNGITRRRTYTTYGYDDNAKMDLWTPTSYYNIWYENVIGRAVTGGTVLAYATLPPSAAGYPYSDGVISGYLYINDGNNVNSSTIDHETGHYFNLYHTWNSSGKGCGEACGDDEVDDTPPTKGHFSTCPANDTECAINYFKIYPDIYGADSLVNYPDTTNTQNTMDYSSCTNMFTKGQVVRVHAALNSNVAGRNNLWDRSNLINTGVGTYDTTTIPWGFNPVTHTDLKPIPEFSATTTSGTIGRYNYMSILQYFTFPGSQVAFHNYTWNDTVTALTWQFSNNALVPTSNSTGTINNSFTDPGWVDVKMTATGNHSGDNTVDFPRAVFVANNTGTPGMGYYQEFNGADTAQWPMFNYYNNEFRWQLANVGYADNTSVMYTGYDYRYNPSLYLYPPTGTPRGDFDDLFSIPMDLSAYTGACSLNFYYSGASRSSMSYNITDTLFIEFAVGKTYTWQSLTYLAKNDLCNKGSVNGPYVPASSNDWALFSVNIPAIAKTPYTTFRFRYKPNTELEWDGTTYSPGIYSSGNNFYMDRITFSPYPAGVGELHLGNVDVAVAPNPTSGDAYVIVKDADNATAHVVVTDITGKVVFSTSQVVTGSEARILVPHAAISVPGMYLVQTTTGNQVSTKKFVVQ
jgi:Pregnancy-associated plasma protein-A/Secretion system C-terminal sorting domain